MKQRLETLLRVLFTLIACSLTIGLWGQNEDADRKIIEIEKYKKYEVMEIKGTDKLDLKDSTTEVIAIGNFTRKKDGLGKSTEESITKGGRRNRTYYFNEGNKLFAIVESLKQDSGVAKRLTYYFAKGQLSQVIDENKYNVTETVDRQRLYNWIRYMFDGQIIVK
jgi:hypothetical protein